MATDTMWPPPGNLVVSAKTEAMSPAVNVAPMARGAQKKNSGLVMRRLREVAHARVTRLEPRQRVLITHLVAITLMSIAALAGALAR